ncbi:MAG TPA: hypothetical protein VHN11_21090 [Xanthobacteraceae bacterium]|jgi:hypothetical protein|nr:hypothetical protein [Xanthobacteraceae bacterium]
MTIHELFEQRARGEGKWPDIAEHLITLRDYARGCSRPVVEFGTRSGNTTTAFLSGGAYVFSYDIEPHQFECPQDAADRWFFRQADTAKLKEIPPCDLLMIDSAHNEAQVRAELRHHVSVRRFIILHDTIEWGTKADDGKEGPGINYALFPFLAEHNRTWRVAAHWNNCRGLTVLERIST